MSTPFHTTVSLYGFNFDDSMFTFNLAAGITAADVGKPMELDTSAANKVKIATDAKAIMGKLESFENRNGTLLGTVSMRFTAQWPVKAADALAIGDQLVGAGSGEVRKRVSAEPICMDIVVVNVSGGIATVMKV